MTIQELVRSRRLERVPADPEAARARLAGCEQHLRSAALIAPDDPDAAYALLYDAARKAVAAHMLAQGLRVRNAPGAHEATAQYAVAVLTGDARRELDRMRRFRNRLEYGASHYSVDQVRHDLENAKRIIAAVVAGLSSPGH